MSFIVKIATRVPAPVVGQQIFAKQFQGFLREFCPRFNDYEWLDKVFKNSKIKQRSMVYLPIWNLMYPQNSHLIEQDAFKQAVRITKNLTQDLLQDTTVKPFDISNVFIGSETSNGMSIDTYSHVSSEFNPDIKRHMSIGMGCLGGVSNLSQAHDYLLAYPDQMVQTVNIDIFSKMFAYVYRNSIQELCQLNSEEAKSQLRSILVSAVILGDAGASTLMVGKKHPWVAHQRRVEIIGSHRNAFPSDNVRFDTKHYGKIPLILQGVPEIGAKLAKETVSALLAKYKLLKKDVGFWVIHPGSHKVVESIRNALELTPEDVQHSFDVWENYGNCASPSVLMVLERQLRSNVSSKTQYGVIMAVGPGVTCECLLVKLGA